MSEGRPGPSGAAGRLAERYLRAVAGQDWETVERCLAPTVGRDGPFGDDVEGIDDYMGLLRRTMPSLPGYRMDLDRVTELGGGRVLVELRETVEIDGAPVVTDECLLLAVDDDDRITRVSIYIRRARASPAGRAVGFAP